MKKNRLILPLIACTVVFILPGCTDSSPKRPPEKLARVALETPMGGAPTKATSVLGDPKELTRMTVPGTKKQFGWRVWEKPDKTGYLVLADWEGTVCLKIFAADTGYGTTVDQEKFHAKYEPGMTIEEARKAWGNPARVAGIAVGPTGETILNMLGKPDDLPQPDNFSLDGMFTFTEFTWRDGKVNCCVQFCNGKAYGTIVSTQLTGEKTVQAAADSFVARVRYYLNPPANP